MAGTQLLKGLLDLVGVKLTPNKRGSLVGVSSEIHLALEFFCVKYVNFVTDPRVVLKVEVTYDTSAFWERETGGIVVNSRDVQFAKAMADRYLKKGISFNKFTAVYATGAFKQPIRAEGEDPTGVKAKNDLCFNLGVLTGFVAKPQTRKSETSLPSLVEDNPLPEEVTNSQEIADDKQPS